MVFKSLILINAHLNGEIVGMQFPKAPRRSFF